MAISFGPRTGDCVTVRVESNRNISNQCSIGLRRQISPPILDKAPGERVPLRDERPSLNRLGRRMRLELVAPGGRASITSPKDAQPLKAHVSARAESQADGLARPRIEWFQQREVKKARFLPPGLVNTAGLG